MRNKNYIVALIAILFLASCNENDEPTPIASFTVDKTAAFTGELITFTNNSQNGKAYEWNFGDGKSTLSTESPTYTYDQAGTYKVELKAISGGGTSTSTTEITVKDSARIFPGLGIDSYRVLETWSNIQAIIARDYEFRPEGTIDLDGTYLHLIDIVEEQIAMFFVSENSSNIEKSDHLFYAIAYGNNSGKTEEQLGIESSITDVTAIYGEPDEDSIFEEGDVLVYFYLESGVDIYFRSDEINEIWVYPEIQSAAAATKAVKKALLNLKAFRAGY